MITVTGKFSLKHIPAINELEYTSRYNEQWLQEKRLESDPLADAVIAKLQKTVSSRNPEDMLREVKRRAVSEGGVYREFIDAGNTIPDWADFNRMRKGQRLIASYGPLVGLSLLTASLVAGAMFTKAAKVIASTGRLSMPGNIYRRLQGTSTLVFYLSFENQIKPGGKAHDTLVKVRLLHAAIRSWLGQADWWRQEWDTPINQQDLAITLSEFSYLNIRSLYRMGVRMTDQQIESHHLLWRYAGHVMGINDELLTTSFEQEIELFLACLKHQGHPKQAPVEARLILDEVAQKAWPLPPPLVKNFLYQATSYLSGREYVEGLQLTHNDHYLGLKLLRGAGKGITVVHNRIPFGEPLLYRAGVQQFKHRLRVMNKASGSTPKKSSGPPGLRKALRTPAAGSF